MLRKLGPPVLSPDQSIQDIISKMAHRGEEKKSEFNLDKLFGTEQILIKEHGDEGPTDG